jgi:arginase
VQDDRVSDVVEPRRLRTECCHEPGSRRDEVRVGDCRLPVPVVVGGGCSILLGCLAAARRRRRCGMVHVDGHSDFFHPGNYDSTARLDSVAGMDLALATGRGEEVLTNCPNLAAQLVYDDDVIQLGDREAAEPLTPSTLNKVADTAITQYTAQQLLWLGIAHTADRVHRRLHERTLDQVWLHVDLDVLDMQVMPAVDSPGSPGLDLALLADLLARLASTKRVIGLDVTVYDPELDPDERYTASIVHCLLTGLAPLASNAAIRERKN